MHVQHFGDVPVGLVIQLAVGDQGDLPVPHDTAAAKGDLPGVESSLKFLVNYGQTIEDSGHFL